MKNETTAKLRRLRISAQKVRLVADMVRGKGVSQAFEILTYCPHKAAFHVKKLLHSAIANAENQVGHDIDELYISTIYVDRGPFLKRFMARAKGRGARILKPTCNIVVGLNVRA